MPLSQNSSSSSTEIITNAMINNETQMCELPDDIMQKIISQLTMDEAIRTSVLSKRWEDAWKQMSHLCFDMRKIITINGVVLPKLLDRGVQLITKVINNHNGTLNTSAIYHYSYQCEDGVLESWIQSLTQVKHTKSLILANFNGRLQPTNESNVLNLSPDRFSHPDLTTLSLYQYILQDANAFNNCRNLQRLELYHIFADVNVFNQVISSCPSLEILILHIRITNPSGRLKIDHKRLKILFMSCNQINGIEVYATRLDLFSIESILCESENVILEIPTLRFGRNYWVAGGIYPHTSINITCQAEDKNSNGMLTWPVNFVRLFASLSISVDLKDPQEVYVLKKILSAWTEKMIELEISFKNNNLLKEADKASKNGEQNKFWEKEEPFPNADFRVETVWMNNFSGSSDEEIALLSCFVMQMTVAKKIMIKTSSYSKQKKMMIEETIAKLENLPKGNEWLRIECF